MPYNRETTVSRCVALVASPGRHSRSGVRVQGFRLAGFVPTVHPVHKIWFQSPAGLCGAMTPLPGEVAWADISMFLAALAIWLSRRMSAPKGEGATQEVRRLAKSARLGRSPAGPTRQFDAKKMRCTAALRNACELAAR